MRNGLFILVTLLLAANPAWALEEIMKNYRGIRSLGMGGVVTTTGRYDESLFGNPATGAENPESRLSILEITGEANDNFISDVSDINAARSAGGTEILSKLADKGLVGKVEHTRLTFIAPGYYNPTLFGENTGFSAGLLVNSQTSLQLHADATLDAQALLDVGPAFAVTHKLLDGNLDLGIQLQGLYRLAGDPSYRATDFLAGQKISLSSIAGQGVGIDTSIGAYYKLPFAVPFFKQIGLGASFNNLMQSTYRVTGRELVGSVRGNPPNNDRTANAGVNAVLPDALVFTDSTFAIEMQNMGTTRRQASFFKKLHFGGETHLFGDLLAVRAGFNQGYVGGGLGLDLPVVDLDFATYGEEMGALTGTLQDRRFAFRLSFNI